MDSYRGGGCCLARYSGNGGGASNKMFYGMSNVDKIMLKFRPIAPKPMASGSGTSSCSTVENRDTHGRPQRRKRKYVRSAANKTKKETKTSKGLKKRKLVSKPSSPCTPFGTTGEMEMKVVTLSLMPETPDRKGNSPITSLSSEKRDLMSLVNKVDEETKVDHEFVEFHWNKPELNLLTFNNIKQQTICYRQMPETSVCNKHVFSFTDYVTDRKKLQTISYVTMECVTNTWINGDDLSLVMDKNQVMNMDMDTCPSFLTDSQDTVVWTNKAYKEMTAGGGGCLDGMEFVMVVKKYNRVTMPVCHTAGFTCRVKVTWGMGRGASPPSTVTAPCDVLRLQGGGFAWRLDVKAALSLGL